MQRCFDLAKSAGKAVKSNPNVGAVLVYKDRIIGEGFHEYYGGPHAEINAFNSVKNEDSAFLKESTLYVTLEPCCIHAKTPPCVQAVLANKVRRVVISVTDPNPQINGQSVKKLHAAGVEVVINVEQQKGEDLIRPFVTNLNKRPYVILKWAQSSGGYLGKKGKQVWLSNVYSKMKVHQWRSELDGILVGHNTAMIDDPLLTTRLVKGDNPVRIVLTNDVKSLRHTQLFTDDLPTVFVGQNLGHLQQTNKSILPLSNSEVNLENLLNELFFQGINRLMIEGGAKTLKRFISSKLWDEARIIRTTSALQSGIRAPLLTGRRYKRESLLDNSIDYLYPR